MKTPKHPSRPAFTDAAELLTGWREQQFASLDEEQRRAYAKLEKKLNRDGRRHENDFSQSQLDRISAEMNRLMLEKPTPELRMLPAQRMQEIRAWHLAGGLVKRRYESERTTMLQDHRWALDNYLRNVVRERQAQEQRDERRQEFNAKAASRTPDGRETHQGQTRPDERQTGAQKTQPQKTEEREQPTRPPQRAPETDPRVQPEFNAKAGGPSRAAQPEPAHEPGTSHHTAAPEPASGPAHTPQPAPHVPEISDSLAARFNARADRGFGQERGFGHDHGSFDRGGHDGHGPGGH